MLHAADRLLVLGEPGSGKTVSLERLAWELCAGSEPTVPVLVRLFHYAGTPLMTWVRARLQETGHLRLDDERALIAFLKEGGIHCFFLFDGLNEVATPYRDRLVEELVLWMSSYPRHPVILTSRSQDELWRQLRGEVGRAVVVQTISDEQARAYLVEYLNERGDDLYGRLDERLRALARTPLILWLIKEAGAAGESVPGNRGDLYARFVSRMLRRDTVRRMDAEIPERVKRRALADLAYHLGQGQRLSCPRDEAVGVVARRLGEAQADDVVAACARHGLLAGEETVWFAPHQTVQEHFAALALREVAEREWGMGRWVRLRQAGRRLLTGREQGLAGLAADDWWMETFVQLAGLVDDADRLAREVARVNPWLAWWCVEEGRGVAEETREAVADRSMGLLDSKRVADRRRAVAALARVRSERVVQPLLRAADDPDAEVEGLAVQALLEMGEAVRVEALAPAQQSEHSLHRAGLAYLEALLGLPMVWVPPGPFLMGSDKGRDSQAYDAELPQHKVTLPGYWIGRYPVTVAQFRAFVEASEYRPADADCLKGPDDHPVVYVDWRDALAFCRWLSKKTGMPVRLPSEAEWEKAARGADGRIYPWGDEPPDEYRCNFGANAWGTTPVGQYSPQGDSPYGCVDMAGNVWEWTQSLYRKYPYDSGDGREKLEGWRRGLRVLRGDAFGDAARYVRCAYRFRRHPSFHVRYSGFRVVASPVHL
jgi:formylglycine-generating enzyme required for sulfatase activity